MRRALSLPAILIAALAGSLAGPSTPADTGSARIAGVVTGGGVHRIEVVTPEGTLSVYLPDDLAAGDRISGTAVAEPKGADERQRQAHGAKLREYSVELAGEPAAPGRAGTWRVPDAAALPVVLRDADGRELDRGEVPVLAGAIAAADFRVPSIAQAGDPFAIFGPFDGLSGNTVVLVGGAPAQILAESPRQVVIATPAGGAGPAEIVVEEGGFRTAARVRRVVLGLSAGDLSLQRGETTTLTVTLAGLAGLDERLRVTVANESPAVVRIEGPAAVGVEPPAVGADGRARHDWTLTGVVPGGFGIRARVTGDEPERLLPVAPAPESSPGGRPDFAWRPFPATGAIYELTLTPVADPPAGAPQAGSAGAAPVLREEGLADPWLPYPATAPPLPPGLYEWRVVARVPGGAAALADTGPILLSVGKCRCRELGSELTALLTVGGRRLTTAPMTRAGGPAIELPRGPIDVAVASSALGCKDCNRERCAVEDVAHTPATATIMPADATQTLAIATRWACRRSGCDPAACDEVFKLDYRLAAKACLCGEIAARVTLGAVTQELVCHKEIEEPQLLDFKDEVQAGNGARLTIRLSDFSVGCWCGAGVCDSRPQTHDVAAGRPVTVDLGEDEGDASNANFNVDRLPGGGWQPDGSYRFDVRVRDEKLALRSAYQDVSLKAVCASEQCTGRLCKCTWRLLLGTLP